MFRVQGLEFRVQGFEFRVQGFEFMVPGVELMFSECCGTQEWARGYSPDAENSCSLSECSDLKC